MKKLILLVALLAMLAVAAIPALAQVTQETEQEGESGDFDQSFEVTGSGDNSNQCVGIQGVGNTGNSQNVIDVIQYSGEADDFEFEEVGSTIDVSPTNTTECTSEVNQAASASSW
jgi:maltose-binding protein MalE